MADPTSSPLDSSLGFGSTGSGARGPSDPGNGGQTLDHIVLRAAPLVLAAMICTAAAGQESASPLVSDEMLQAGTEALRQALSADPAASSADLSGAAERAFAAMYEHQWRPIETAPLNEEILLGLAGPDGFVRGLGFWEVHDEAPFDGGRWNVSEWWGAAPTHWMPVPPPPASD